MSSNCSRSHTGNDAPFHPSAYQDDITQKLEDILQKVRRSTKNAKQRQARYYNLRRRDVKFQLHDLVRKEFKGFSSAINKGTAKFFPRYVGPFEIVEVLSPTQYGLSQLDGKNVGCWHVSQLRPYVEVFRQFT